MFHNKFITCIKVDGEIVREEKQNVYLPYGTAFEMYFKNIGLDRVRLLSVTLNGEETPLRFAMSMGGIYEPPEKFMFKEDCELRVDWEVLDGSDRTNKSMSFFIKGVNTEEQISEVNTTQGKKICTSCGKKWKSLYNYCPMDGTYLSVDS